MPVPEVHFYSSTAEGNLVGAEYIIMEKAPGVQLAGVWEELDENQRRQILEAIIQFEKRFAVSTFSAIGSLYYAEDMILDGRPLRVEELEPNLVSNDRQFVIGPTTARQWFDEGRGQVECYRGPCIVTISTSVLAELTLWPGLGLPDYREATAIRELAYVKSLTKCPPSARMLTDVGSNEPIRAKAMAVLKDFLKIAPRIHPDDDSIAIPVLWHDYLDSKNIFVDPEDPTQITCIIDWQAAHISPLFQHARYPYFLNSDWPMPVWADEDESTFPSKRPENYLDLSEEEQKATDRRVRQGILVEMYETESSIKNPRVARAIEFQRSIAGQLFNFIGMTGFNYALWMQDMLIKLADHWERIKIPGGIDCPIHYSEHDRKTHKEEYEAWKIANDATATLIRKLPLSPDGEVANEIYDELKKSYQACGKKSLT